MIRTFSGVYVNPLAMRARDVRIADIAHHLARICRYTGACPEHYSVAQHSVLTSIACEAMYPTGYDLQLACLLHDAAEYVFNDIASPVKKDPRMQWYADLEHQTARMIFCVFGLDPDLLALTKPFDNSVFHSEVTWWTDAPQIIPVQPYRAEMMLLERFEYLQFRRANANHYTPH